MLSPFHSHKDRRMNAAKKIRKFLEEGHDPAQMQVLKDLAAALEMGRSFDLSKLYDIDMRYFDVAIDLLQDWRFDHHIASRSKLLEQLLCETAAEAQVALPKETQEEKGKKDDKPKRGKDKATD
nr:hypothetical protein [Chromobacterium sp. ASV5]